MIPLFLFIITICSFLFYGVAGADKTWLLAPAFVLNFALVTIALFRKALGTGRQVVGGVGREPSLRATPLSRGDPASSRQGLISDLSPSCKLIRAGSRSPISGSLWLLFMIYGVAMISQATVPFESKLVTLFIGGVVGAFIVWGGELTTFKDNRTLLSMLIFVVMLTALYGTVVHFRCPDRVLWAERYAVYEGRLMSTYICPNHFAHLLQMLLPFCLVLLFIPQAGIYLRILAGYSLLIFLPPLYLTESRAGWLGSIAAIGITVCLMALRRSKKLFLLLVILVPLCSTLLLVGGWKYSETFQRRMEPVVHFLQQQSDEGIGSEARDFRPQTWMDTIDMIKQQPLIGFGPGNYRYTFPEYRNRFKGNRIVTGHPHNEYLELMADYGLLGFGLFSVAWIYGLIRILISSFKTPNQHHAFMGMAFLGTAVGTMVHSFVDFQMHVYPNALVFALLAALAAGPLARARSRAQGAESRGQRSEDRGQGTKDRGRKGRGKAALEFGGELSLSLPSGLINRERTHNGRQRTASGSYEPAARREGREQQSAVSGQRAAVRGQQKIESLKPKAYSLQPSWLLSWVLAIGFLIGTAFCLQIMSSAFIRALGDKASEVRNIPKAEQYYQLAAKIDPQNWRAYKGMGEIYHNQRYYTLEMSEKVQMAVIEKAWYEKAYQHNSHDPEIIRGLGKCLVFLGKQQGFGRLALGVGEKGGEGFPSSTERPPSSTQRPASSTQHPTPNAQRTEDRREKLIANSHQSLARSLVPNAQSPVPSDQTARGLSLLREACNYRKFNDSYWWTLGVELRKAGLYEEAIDVFQYAATIKRTPSITKNIQWIEARLQALGAGHQALEEGGGQRTEISSQRTEDRGQRTEIRGQQSEVSGRLPARMSLPLGETTEDGGLSKDLRLKRDKTDLSELLDMMEK